MTAVSSSTENYGIGAWLILSDNPDFLAHTQKEGLGIFEQFVSNFPETEKDLFNEDASIETVLQTKLRFLKYCIENKLINSYYKATNSGKILLKQSEKKVKLLIHDLERLLNSNINDSLKDIGLTEETFLKSIGLTTNNLTNNKIHQVYGSNPYPFIKQT